MFILSTVLSFAGLAAALGVTAVGTLTLLRRFGWLPLGYTAVALWYGATLVGSLIRQSSGIVCAMTPGRTLVVYGGLLALHVYFLWDLLRALRTADKRGEAEPGER